MLYLILVNHRAEHLFTKWPILGHDFELINPHVELLADLNDQLPNQHLLVHHHHMLDFIGFKGHWNF